MMINPVCPATVVSFLIVVIKVEARDRNDFSNFEEKLITHFSGILTLISPFSVLIKHHYIILGLEDIIQLA